MDCFRGRTYVPWEYMVANYENLKGFTPEKFVVKAYDFKISPPIDQANWQKGIKGLGENIHKVLKNKARRRVA